MRDKTIYVIINYPSSCWVDKISQY